MGVVIAGAGGATREDAVSGALVIDGSLRFDSTKTQHLKRTPSSTGNRRTWTFSCWYRALKRGTGANGYRAFFGSLNTYINHSGAGGGATEDDLYWNLRDAGTNYFGEFAELFRDPGAWYHIVWSVDTTQSTSSNRAKLYVNNVALGAAGAGPNGINYPPQSTETPINATSNVHYIGANDGASNPMEGQLTQVYLIDGQALDPSYFGYIDPLTNTWRPRRLKVRGNPNNGTVWSNYLTSSTGSFQNAATNTFDANGWSTGATPSAGGATLTFTPPTPIPVNSSLRVYAISDTRGSYETTLQVNGITIPNITSSDGNDFVYNCGVPSSGVLSSLSLARLSVRGAIYYIEVDGVMLVDSSTNNDYNFGVNGFYLPFDGNSPIGQDRSGRGNNWTPVNFGGSNTIEKATGALPILNTDGGGKVARVGVRTDSSSSSLVLALPLVGIKSDFSNKINSGTTEKVVTNTGTADASNAQSIFYGGSFYFDGTNDYLSIPNNSDFNPGTGDFTIECWIYPTAAGGNGVMIASQGGTAFGDQDGWSLLLQTDKKILFYSQSTPYPGSTNSLTSTNTIQLNTWNHIALTRNGSTQRIFLNGVLDNSNTSSLNIGTGYPFYVGRSQGLNGEYWSRYSGYMNDFRFYKGLAKYTQNFIPASTDPDILPDTPSGVAYSSNVALVPSTDGAVAFDGSDDKLSISKTGFTNVGSSDPFTIEAFVYFNALTNYSTIFASSTGSSGAGGFKLEINNSLLRFTGDVSSSGTYVDITSGPTLSTGRWYHLAVTRDVSGNVRTFVDGQIAGTDSTNTGFSITWPYDATIGTKSDDSEDFSGFISNLHFVNGTALYTSNFTPPTAPITSVANTKLLCCKSNSSATAYDVSPGTITANGNAAATNFNPFTVNINTQRGQESGYCTFNPLKTGSVTLSDGNLKITYSGADHYNSQGTVGITTGKWYYEVTCNTVVYLMIGVGNENCPTVSAQSSANGWVWALYPSSVTKYNNNVGTSYGTAGADGDVVGVAIDRDAGTLTFYKNGISQGQAFNNLSGTIFPLVSAYNGGVASANFGQKPFKFPPPAGFQPLALANTPRPTIVRPDQYVGIVTYSGNSATRNITVGWKPDLVWLKNRNSTYEHQLYDTVRGATKQLKSNSTTYEETNSTSLTSFNSDGFTLGSEVGANETGKTYVAWAWKAGGNSNTYNINDVGYSTASAAGLTAGTITPTGASVNTKSGFSIVSFTSDSSTNIFSVAHGLQNTPKFVIVKSRDNGVAPWYVYHSSLATDNYLRLNGTNATASDGANQWGNGMTSSVIGLRAGYTTVASTATIAYCWAEIPGFSKFGSYTGNGSSDGPMIVTGFRPRWILVRNVSVTQSWALNDTERAKYNLVDAYLAPNLTGSEQTTYAKMDILSNGFKVRETDSFINGNGNTHIYAAFAETPSFNLYGGQSNAR